MRGSGWLRFVLSLPFDRKKSKGWGMGTSPSIMTALGRVRGFPDPDAAADEGPRGTHICD